jgi:tRNA (guanine-N7-)-methyltransferase
MLNPDRNPYVSRLEEHRDIIKTLPIESNLEFFDFVRSPGPLIVDLGCGAGNFLRDYAVCRPETRFVGFELRYKRLVKGAVKLKKHAITNVRLVQARAEDIDLWLPQNSTKEIHVNFPDPWPKNRHRKHRLISERFLSTLRRLLTPEGSFFFKTDHEDYFHYVVDRIDACPFLETTAYSEDLHRSEYNEYNILTEFELLFKKKGFPVFYLKTNLR